MYLFAFFEVDLKFAVSVWAFFRLNHHHIQQTALHTLCCRFKEYWVALLSRIIPIILEFFLRKHFHSFHPWLSFVTSLYQTLKQLNEVFEFLSPWQPTYWCCLKRSLIQRKRSFCLRISITSCRCCIAKPQCPRNISRWEIFAAIPAFVHSPVFRELLFNKRSKSCDVGILGNCRLTKQLWQQQPIGCWHECSLLASTWCIAMQMVHSLL